MGMNQEQWWKCLHHQAPHECKSTQNKHVRLANWLGVSKFAPSCSEEHTESISKQFANICLRATKRGAVIYYGCGRQINHISIKSTVNYKFVVTSP